MKLIVRDTFSNRMKAGQEVECDAIKIYRMCNCGLMVRIVGVWKEPCWFDLGWFYHFGERLKGVK